MLLTLACLASSRSSSGFDQGIVKEIDLSAKPLLNKFLAWHSILGPSVDDFMVATWNARALLHGHDPTKREAKMNKVEHLMTRHTCTAVQETHGNDEVMKAFLVHRDFNFFVYDLEGNPCWSNGAHKDSHGGICNLISRRKVAAGATVQHIELVPGRAMASVISKQADEDGSWCEVDFVNIHNEQLSSADLKKIKEWALPRVERANKDPRRYGCIFLGDLNSAFRDSIAYDLHNTSLISQQTSSLHHPKFWHGLLEDTLHIDSNEFNHWDGRSRVLSTLSRAFVTLPSWAAVHTQINASCEDPIVCCEKGLSDHSPLSVSLRLAGHDGLHSRKIPMFVARSSEFKLLLSSYLEVAELDKLHPVRRWEAHKDIIDTVGRRARNMILQDDPLSPTADLQLLFSLASCVAFNKVETASCILKRNPRAQKHIAIVDKIVVLNSPQCFSSAFIEARQKCHDCQIAEIERSASKTKGDAGKQKRQRNLLQKLQRWARLWKQKSRSLSLQGVYRPDQTVARTSEDKAAALGNYWAEIFSNVNLNETELEDEIKRFCENCVTKWAFSSAPPSPEDIKRFLLRVANSSPGPDGIPYCAWLDLDGYGPVTLFLLSTEFMAGNLPPIVFGQALGAFLAKGENELDKWEVVRDPSDTRPLTMRNTDAKTIAGAANYKIRQEVTNKLHSSQQGFTMGGQTGNNIVAIDTWARVLAFDNPWAICILLDLAQAFPSVFHCWIFRILEAYGFPEGFTNLVKALYSFCTCYFQGAASQAFLFYIWAGVLQGCPLSGILFAVAVNPLVIATSKFDTRTNSVTKWFADDCASVMDHPKRLLDIKALFDHMVPLTGLKLKASKFVVIILGEGGEATRSSIQDWMQEWTKEWAGAKVDFCGKYLGAWIGPAAGSKFFKDVFSKWVSRTRAIADAGTSAFISIKAYNTYAISVLGYLFQFHPPPKFLVDREAPLLATLLKIPYRALGTHGPFLLGELGLQNIHSIVPFAQATMARAANRTFDWEAWARKYREAACEHLSFRNHGSAKKPQCLQQLWWDSAPIALNLESYHGECSWDHLCLPIENGSAKPWPEFHLTFEAQLPGKKKAHKSIRTKLAQAIALEHKPQKLLYHTLHWYWHACRFSWAQLIKDRLGKFGDRHSIAVSWEQIASWENWAVEIGKMKPFQSVSVIRTLTNAWVTSSRIPNGSHVYNCVFRCSTHGGSDRLGHYVSCPVLWQFLADAFRTKEGPTQLNISERLGLSEDPRKLLVVAAATHVYHSFRHSAKARSSNFLEWCRALRVSLNTFFLLSGGKFKTVSLPSKVWSPGMFERTLRLCDHECNVPQAGVDSGSASGARSSEVSNNVNQTQGLIMTIGADTANRRVGSPEDEVEATGREGMISAPWIAATCVTVCALATASSTKCHNSALASAAGNDSMVSCFSKWAAAANKRVPFKMALRHAFRKARDDRRAVMDVKVLPPPTRPRICPSLCTICNTNRCCLPDGHLDSQTTNPHLCKICFLSGDPESDRRSSFLNHGINDDAITPSGREEQVCYVCQPDDGTAAWQGGNERRCQTSHVFSSCSHGRPQFFNNSSSQDN